MRLEGTSRSPRLSSFFSMRSMALSIRPVLTGRLRSASLNEASNLSCPYSTRRPSFFTTAGKLTSERSEVVKRLLQAAHWRRRRMDAASSKTRVSMTWVSRWLQKGHFMAASWRLYRAARRRAPSAVDRKAGRQRVDLGAHRSDVGRVARLVQQVGDQLGRAACLFFLEAARGHCGGANAHAAGHHRLFRIVGD